MAELTKVQDRWEKMGDENNGLFQCNLSDCLKMNHLLLKDLADMLGLSNTYISMIGSGQVIPPAHRMWTISRIFNVNVEQIWIFNDNMVPELLELAKMQVQENRIHIKKKELMTKINEKIMLWKNREEHLTP